MKISGVYKITNLINDKSYYGSSIHIYSRWREHKYSLDHKKHKNRYLQRAWLKYGKENFEFEIIELCESKNCLLLEQQYLDKFKPFQKNGYNIYKIAGSGYGLKHTDKTKKILSDLAKLRKHSQETKNKISESLKGDKNPFFGKHHTEKYKQSKRKRIERIDFKTR